MRKFIFPSERLRAQTRMLQIWIAVWLLLQGLCQVSGDPVAMVTTTAEKAPEGPAAGGMSEEQKAFLKWYYRTEDPSSWKYAMLGLSFVALLLGSVLLVIGTMANRSRRKLAQYKAVARAVQSDELQGLAAGAPQAKTPPQEDTSADTPTSPASQTPHAGQPNGKTLKGILTTPDCDSHEGEHGQISAPQHESEAVQICQPPQESEPVQISVTPQDTEPLQTDVPPQETEPLQTDVPPQETEPLQTDVPPQDTEPARVGVQSEESEAVQMSVAPQGNESPQIITAPLASEHADVSQTSQASEPAQSSQEHEPVQNGEPQESRSGLASPQDGAVTEDSTSADAIS